MKEIKIKTAEIEVSLPLHNIPLDGTYDECYCLVRQFQTPLGWVRIKGLIGEFQLTANIIRSEIARQLRIKLFSSFLAEQFRKEHPGELSEGISIVVCTRNRPHYLESCLKSLIEINYPVFEIIVVDNAPNDKVTFLLAGKYGVRYVLEKSPGLNWARNAGASAAKYEIVAFTDDDALVDRNWLNAIAKGFLDPGVMAVSGFVAPLHLDTLAKQNFEFVYGGMGHGFQRRSISTNNTSRKRLLWAGSLGVGVNMAFRNSVFSKVGRFDVALDAGTPSRGGGDIEMLFRITISNYPIVYLPEAIVWHSHRSDQDGLRKQINDNGCSFACFLYTVIDKGYVSAIEVRKFMFLEWIFGWQITNLVRPDKPGLRRLVWYEFRGMLSGRKAYLASQQKAKEISNAFVIDGPK